MRSQPREPDGNFSSRRHHATNHGTHCAKENEFGGIQCLDKVSHYQVALLEIQDLSEFQ